MPWVPDVIRPLERFETLLAALYAAFAEKFAADAEAAKLFTQLSKDSKALAQQLGFVQRLAKSIERSLGDVPFDPSRIGVECTAVERITGLVAQVPLETAVGQSLQLECGGSKAISRTALPQAHPDLAQMIRGFGLRRDAEHAPLLTAFAAARSIPLPPALAAAAEAQRAAAKTAAEQAQAVAEAQKRLLAEKAAEEARMAEAIKAGKSIIDFRMEEQARQKKKD